MANRTHTKTGPNEHLYELEPEDYYCFECALPDCLPYNRCCKWRHGENTPKYVPPDNLNSQQRYYRKKAKDPEFRKKRVRETQQYRLKKRRMQNVRDKELEREHRTE